MTDPLEQQLTHELHGIGTTVETPPAPLAALVQAGRRRQRRTRAIALLSAAAAVAVVATGVTVGPNLLRSSSPVAPVQPGPSPAPTTAADLTDLPTGPPPGIPYWHNGVLFAHGDRIATPYDRIITGGDTVVVGSPFANDINAWWLVDDGRLIPVLRSEYAAIPQVSADGRLVVWTQVQPEVTRVIAWDVATHRVLATRDVTIRQRCCDGPSLQLYGADGHGRVYFSAGEELTVWTPATGTAQPVTGLGDLPFWPSAVTATGLVFQDHGESVLDSPGVYGNTDDAGTFHRGGTVPTDQLGSWSPDARLLAYGGDERGDLSPKAPPVTQVVLDVSTGATKILGLPADTEVSFTRWWEPASHSLLLEVAESPRQHALVRCDADAGACELALNLPDPANWAFPGQSGRATQ